ncbi:hypothetical protein [Crocosphaera sp.]|uniref:hypothetical protein n=1 Tax=Crocosphaera sp. TaxID=2729996 RepID=UPI003F275356|nr:hypothetical protein [Crocosphaera sp.]
MWSNFEVRFCPVKLRSPERLKATDGFNVHAVYATEINVPEGEDPISWMLLTTEKVESISEANTILRWYSYRALPTVWCKKYNRLHNQNGGLQRRPKVIVFSSK